MTLRILLVEDDPHKHERLLAALAKFDLGHELIVVASVQSAVAAIDEGAFDFILLDMALPSHQLKPGGGPSTSMLSGGVEVIMELSYLNRPDRVIVITQYPEIEIEGDLVPVDESHERLSAMFGQTVVKVIQYDHESDKWEAALLRTLR
jgi:CheY-like chemotaxis protein